MKKNVEIVYVKKISKEYLEIQIDHDKTKVHQDTCPVHRDTGWKPVYEKIILWR